MVFFSFAQWRFVSSKPKIRRTVHGMFFMIVLFGQFWVVFSCTVGSSYKNLKNR